MGVNVWAKEPTKKELHKEKMAAKLAAKEAVKAEEATKAIRVPEVTKARKVKKAMEAFGKQLADVQKDQPIRESKTNSAAQEQARSILIDTMNEIGLDAKSMAGMLKQAIEMSLTTGRIIKDKNDPSGRTSITVPDLRSFQGLAFLWGNWMAIGRPSVKTATFNLFGAAGERLSEDERKRVACALDRIETEVKRRGLPDILPGDIEAQDAQALPGVVDAGGEGEAATH